MEAGALALFLRETLRKNSRVKLESIRDPDVITRDLGFDSFSLLNVILDLEDKFGIEIDPARLESLREITFAEFVALVGEHLAGNAQAAADPGPPGSAHGAPGAAPGAGGGAGR